MKAVYVELNAYDRERIKRYLKEKYGQEFPIVAKFRVKR